MQPVHHGLQPCLVRPYKALLSSFARWGTVTSSFEGPFIYLFYFILFYMYLCLACMYVCAPCARLVLAEVARSRESRVTVGCENWTWFRQHLTRIALILCKGSCPFLLLRAEGAKDHLVREVKARRSPAPDSLLVRYTLN